MKSLIFVLAACLAAIYTPLINADESTFTIDVVSPNKVRFENVSVVESEDGISVLVGKLKRSVYNSTVLPGHVDYAIKDGKGVLIVEGGAQYSPSLSLRRWRHGSSFSIALPEELPDDVIVQVGYHRNVYKAQVYSPAAPHSENQLL